LHQVSGWLMPKLWGIQYLRAVAAITVLFFHAALGAGRHDALGTAGVDIFFVISGFLMFQLASREPTCGKFAWDRIKRIVPAYWVVTLIVAAIQLGGGTENSTFDFRHLVKSLAFIPDMDALRGQVYPTLIVGWTLNYEMFFYAVVTGLLLIEQNLRFFALSFLFSALIIIGLVLQGSSVVLDFYSAPIVLEFVAGAMLSELWRAKMLPRSGWVLVVVGTLLMILPQPFVLPRFIGYGIPAFIIVLGILAEEFRSPIKKIALLSLFGNASYSIYLWHLFIVTATFRVLGSNPAAFGLALLGGIGIGVTFYWIFELPTGRLFSRLESFRAREADPRA
jgi:exopolysaccharide production protein ExoZ